MITAKNYAAQAEKGLKDYSDLLKKKADIKMPSQHLLLVVKKMVQYRVKP